ncbi:MAG: cell division protein ZapA [Limisphaerales bacterium]
MSTSHTVTVRILDKEYQVACSPEEVDSLTRSARFLDERMAGIRNSGKVVGLDRIAVMAALNIAHEYLTEGSQSTDQQDAVQQRLDRLSERVGQALAEHKQMDL